ncbi:uncharacterized protein LOC110991228 [Acanthaster planci]|uniref:Uncharacterized protein LOC110991228 n=1 Tax=Acanthaster planci TaxID=133434 RepID=A0A8B8A800_ACAPL|nr:uncharacterized protein LOC110991228 [Acanthaster planci]XP_022112193.1 uncharacterized protein LOC110991228 [Acanthaster planci]XP_022112194.1 uncharacterized protein LOC110991228 [Acanthaster planci]XP_022112195.1 uncharacterized protein LOC110991228 [Acanthaster planci]
MSSPPKKFEHRLSLKDGLQGDSVDSGSSTPQGFLYETKFVVLNYLGLVPPDLDPGYSEFDIHYESSASATPFSVSDDDRSSASSGSRRSSDLLTVNTKARARRSPKISPQSSASSSHPSPAVVNSSASVFAGFSAPQPIPSAAQLPLAPSSDSITVTTTQQIHSRSFVAVSRTVVHQGESFDSDLCTDSCMDGEDDSSQSQPLSEGSEEDRSGECPVIKIDDDSTGDSWELQQRHRQELVEPLQEEVRQAMAKLQDEFKQVVAAGDASAPILPSAICPFSREALVAERIAQIGDKIMQQRGDELEKTMRMLLGSQSDNNLTYSLFKSLLKQMMKSTAPGWYHLALMLKFTQHMALGLVNRGGQGFGSLTNFAVRYIEENLAQTIIDQGGWDAMTNINLEDINTEILTELSSGTASPIPLSSQESHASQSQEPMSPDAGTPVDSPNWHTDQQAHFTSSGEEGLNQLIAPPPSTSPGEITHRSRSESRPEDLASLFKGEASDPPLSHSVSSPTNLGDRHGSPVEGLGGTCSAPVLFTFDGSAADESQVSMMDVDSQPLTSSGECLTDVRGGGSDKSKQDSDGEQKTGIGKVAAAVKGALFGTGKN